MTFQTGKIQKKLAGSVRVDITILQELQMDTYTYSVIIM